MDDLTRLTICDLLERCMAGYGKPMPDKKGVIAWFSFLERFDVEDIHRAFSEYCESSDFPPTPIAIARRCQKKHEWLSADEAWALAIQASDEAQTVVWTDEAQRAFFTAKPVLDEGDKIGARMAFKAAYERLVEQAQKIGQKPRFSVSVGHDRQMRYVAIQEAVSKGQLPTSAMASIAYQPDVQQLEASKSEQVNMEKVRQEIAKLRAMLTMKKAAAPTASEVDRQKTIEAKERIASQVKDYMSSVA